MAILAVADDYLLDQPYETFDLKIVAVDGPAAAA